MVVAIPRECILLEHVRELRPGMKVGRFFLEREVARGGMGSVWAARDGEAGGRRVALKTVLTSRHSTQKLASLFVEEARISGAVRHPNLLEMIDAGEDDGVPFLAMEWVEGITLRRLTDRTGRSPRLSLPLLLRVCMEACDGLHAAHEARTDDGDPLCVVHRDVSPQNLLVSEDGRVKVIDFGIAKAKGRLAEETTDGVLRGKVRYMAPEHALGHDLDRRADIWSLGVTLLETSTGRTPYSGEHDIATLVKLVSSEPDLREDASLPPAVWAVIRRALRKNPEERYATAREMGTDLEKILDEMGSKHTRRELAYLVREELRAIPDGSANRVSISDRATERVSPARLILAREPAIDSITARVPESVLSALIDHELREKPTASDRPAEHPTPVVPPDLIPALFVSTSTAMMVSTDAVDRESYGDSGELATFDPDASGPVPRPGRRRSGFVLASVLMLAVLVAVVGIRGRTIGPRLRGLAIGSQVAPPPLRTTEEAPAPFPVEAVSIAPFRLPAPMPSAPLATSRPGGSSGVAAAGSGTATSHKRLPPPAATFPKPSH